VREVAVLALPDEQWGQPAWAVFIAVAGVGEDALRDAASAQHAPYKRPSPTSGPGTSRARSPAS
jgi:acyl-CoA synthetase (AMP-forming)/AMP-acid ligase II